MLTPVRSTQFKRDVKKARKQGKDLTKLRTVLAALIRQEPLAVQQRDHPLRGIWKGYRETHVETDRLLIYRVEGSELHLVRIGSHSDLFTE
ncbi:MAG: type II toxin-antitoxin system YafQ family toxin [Nitrospira sp. SB0677_bin_15]|nr:type II toxin-antitoxin system YafQ family toxin [Nitrospira sp. SB0667_bin_9]MYD30968.1 type II toxin-antitoxin system YafQ family toxin [Nitrospira sp. SB0661_bin_20]MYG40083.1 type II toxin-antitoxin system YafQ family toxin [Nitrospira sp. SB0677_bin_15]MYH02870.1 type II toxin-antitoxin system YafQ family toxin [Nitrospira sp. SB0675_bin_23]MYJ22232.1 type II toxin-antitoxin system YafQ family toxin [Nitrospira sp. SB0673_bin_12]